MTFSHGGRGVKGTWSDRDADPGGVEFTEVKTQDLTSREYFLI